MPGAGVRHVRPAPPQRAVRRTRSRCPVPAWNARQAGLLVLVFGGARQARTGGAVDLDLVDLLLADGLVDLLLLGDRLGAQPDPLDGDGLLAGDRALRGEGDLVLLFGEVAPGRRRRGWPR